MQQLLLTYLADILHWPADKIIASAVGGGSINRTFRLSWEDQKVFCKVNSSTRYPSLFKNELQGLQLLRDAAIFRVPEVLHYGLIDEYQLLVLEFIEEGRRDSSFWKTFGEQLFLLHEFQATQCGLDGDNYMGSLPQNNTWMNDWASFFISKRLKPQVQLASAAGLLSKEQVDRFDHLYQHLPILFGKQDCSLLHGDLWSGNFMCDANGQPVLIDPAVYYGSRHMDLAMTTLFGGFDELFYRSYQQNYTLPPNHKLLWEVCNLYPLLIHLNLFGKSYLPSILSTLGQF